MLGHGAGIGYTGPGPRMGPIDNFRLMTGPSNERLHYRGSNSNLRLLVGRYGGNFLMEHLRPGQV